LKKHRIICIIYKNRALFTVYIIWDFDLKSIIYSTVDSSFRWNDKY